MHGNDVQPLARPHSPLLSTLALPLRAREDRLTTGGDLGAARAPAGEAIDVLPPDRAPVRERHLGDPGERRPDVADHLAVLGRDVLGEPDRARQQLGVRYQVVQEAVGPSGAVDSNRS